MQHHYNQEQDSPTMSAPVQKLVAFQRDEISRHLQQLAPPDRRLRFGTPMTDAAIDRYVRGIDFARDKVFGIIENGLVLSGVAHLALDPGHDSAELGLSVVTEHRGKGHGYTLLERAKLHARNLMYKKLYMHCLAENQVMIHLARKAGMTVVTQFGEADAHVALGDGPLTDYTREAIGDQIALVDYLFKRQTHWLSRKRG
jgi:RimJ/RimL family protein N-acetyltransferase